MTQLQERPVHALPTGEEYSDGTVASPAPAHFDVGHWRREYVHTPVPPPRGTNRLTRLLKAHRQLSRTVLSTVAAAAVIAVLVGAALTFLPWHPWATADAAGGLSASAVSAGDRPAGIAISSDAREVFVANAGSAKVMILKADDLSLIQSIPVPGLSPIAIAVDSAHHQLFVLDQASRTVRGIDTTTGAATSRFSAGSAGTALAVDPARHRLYVANAADGGSVWVYDLSSGNRVATLGTTGKPVSIALNTTSRRLYVLAGGRIAGFNSATLKPAGTTRKAAGGTSIAVDSGNRYLYLAGAGTMKRWDLSTGISGTIAISGSPSAISASTPGAAAFVAVPDQDRVTRFTVR